MLHRVFRLLPAATAGALLAGCVATPGPGTAPGGATVQPGVGYQCEGGLRFRAQLEAETARLDGLPGGPDDLLRDAGGLTPQQRVYSGPRMRVEFGLGPDGGGAVLQLLQPQPATLRCQRA